MGLTQLTEEYGKIFNEYRKEVDKQIIEKGFADVQEFSEKLNDLYSKICEASKIESLYFTGASLSTYKRFLNNGIKKAQEEKPEFSIYSALKKEYEIQRNYLFSPPRHYKPLNPTNLNNFKSVIKKRLEYLELKMFEMGIDIKTTYSEMGRSGISFTDNLERRFQYEKTIKATGKENKNDNSIQPLKWTGNNVELAELIKALISSNKLDTNLSQEEIFKRFGKFLQFDLNERKGIDNLQTRKPETAKDTLPYITKFLDQLRAGLIDWYTKKEEDKNYR